MNKLGNGNKLQFDEKGLIPAIVQDWLDGTVLMVGFMNQDALTETVRTRKVHFWSRSRERLWKKGETSGHELLVKTLSVDCDHDTLLVKVEPVGPTCHTGQRSCFFSEIEGNDSWGIRETAVVSGSMMEGLYQIILNRKEQPKADSYVSKLLQDGTDRILKKVVEEAGEVVLATKNQNRQEIVHEMADLWFHALIVLGQVGIPPREIFEELGRRFGKSGLRKKEAESE
jgi:phosphoribosyl-ATP pyrophosphohydrolase/phosphoribosyl-AMP cyclohydrolase